MIILYVSYEVVASKLFEGKTKRIILVVLMALITLCAFGLSACGVDDDYTNLGREFVQFD